MQHQDQYGITATSYTLRKHSGLMVLSILVMCFLTWLCGIPAIICTARANKANSEEAEAANVKRAKDWLVGGVVFGLIINAYIILRYLAG